MDLLGWSLLPLILIWAFERFYLRGSNIPVFPVPLESGAVKRFSREEGPGDEHLQVVKSVRELMFEINNFLQKSNINKAREAFDSISANLTFASKFIACDADGVPAEWVIAPGADNSRRVLYIHGGGFVMGSDFDIIDPEEAIAREVTTSSGQKTIVGPKASVGSLSSGGLY